MGCVKSYNQGETPQHISLAESRNKNAQEYIQKAVPETSEKGKVELGNALSELKKQVTDFLNVRQSLANEVKAKQDCLDDKAELQAKYDKQSGKWYNVYGVWIERAIKFVLGSIIAAAILRILSIVLLGKYPAVARGMGWVANLVFGLVTGGISKLTSVADIHQKKIEGGL